jgi:hypothetical protein
LAPLGLSILCVSVAAVSEEFSVPAREVSDERLAMGISTALKSSLRVTIAVDWSLRVAPPLVLDGAAFGTDINWICDVAEMSSLAEDDFESGDGAKTRLWRIAHRRLEAVCGDRLEDDRARRASGEGCCCVAGGERLDGAVGGGRGGRGAGGDPLDGAVGGGRGGRGAGGDPLDGAVGGGRGGTLWYTRPV